MSNYEVDILVRGRPIRQFKHNGNLFVEGRRGSKFELKFTNNTWQRVEVSPSVDGLSIMDGEECGVENNGYLVPARQSIVIPGWRLDDDNIAKFLFKGKNKSYSAKSGHGTDNVGAIGFMVFQEKINHNCLTINTTPWPLYNTTEIHHHHHHKQYNPFGIGGGATCDSGWLTTNNVSSTSSSGISYSATRGAKASMGDDVNVPLDISPKGEGTWNLGVGFGEEDSHKVHEVAFTRENALVPYDIMTIYYDSRKGLEARGIQVVKTKKRAVSDLPNPFPTYGGSGCTPPPGWKGRK